MKCLHTITVIKLHLDNELENKNNYIKNVKLVF